MKRAAMFLGALPLVLVLAAADQKVAYRLPPEPQVKLWPGADEELAEGTCAACHSLDYIKHQPPKMGRAFWNAEVTKMREAYGADIDDETAQKIAAYLAGEEK
jgi:hypothetical protein